MVAIRAEEGSTRTVGAIGLQLGLGLLTQGEDVDSVLSGPTNEMWILSVDISDWETPGLLYGKPAKECDPIEIKNEVWLQILAHLDADGQKQLTNAKIMRWFLDPAIVYPNHPSKAVNLDRAESPATRAAIWPLTGPSVFRRFKEWDRLLFERGERHSWGHAAWVAFTQSLPFSARRAPRGTAPAET
jgi:hypothetical protein